MALARRLAPVALLAVSFAVFVQMAVVLTGRMSGAAFATAIAAGALVVAALGTRDPLAAVRGLSRSAAGLSALAGALAIAGAPALIAGLRMSDAPAGSIVVFWVSGGWAAMAACGAAVIAPRKRRRLSAAWSIAGALLTLVGVAGVVANWERPSSFSPWVRFADREIGMMLGGLLLLVGGLLLLRVARAAKLDSAFICGAASALAVSLVWLLFSGLASGWASVASRPLETAVAALAWGLVCSSWLAVLKGWGPSVGAASLAVAPVLLSALIWVERLVGVAGPNPLIVPGVIAGSLLVLAGVCALARASAAQEGTLRRELAVVAAMPVAMAVVGLALPAIVAKVDVSVQGGLFSSSWTMPGAESVAGLAAVALAVLVLVAAYDARAVWPVLAALVASAAWPWLLDVPTHVWSAGLAPQIQIYYGTEYGSIVFSAAPNPATILGVVGGAVVMVVMMVVRLGKSAGRASRPGNGGQ